MLQEYLKCEYQQVQSQISDDTSALAESIAIYQFWSYRELPNMLSFNPLRPGAASTSHRDTTTARAFRKSYIREINEHICSKQLSAVEVTKQYLDQLQRVEGAVNSFITVDAESAIKQVNKTYECEA